MAEIRDGRSIYVDNPRFLQPGRPVIKQVVEQVVPTTADRLRALQNGDVDMIAVIPPTHQQLAQSIPNVRLVSQSLPECTLSSSISNVANCVIARCVAPWTTPRRAAICSGVGIVLDERNRLVTGPLPGSFGYNAKVEPRPYDPYSSRGRW
ncbi:MAG: hypothetical protein U1D30_25470 [Planctomycetota bacterium]